MRPVNLVVANERRASLIAAAIAARVPDGFLGAWAGYTADEGMQGELTHSGTDLVIQYWRPNYKDTTALYICLLYTSPSPRDS